MHFFYYLCALFGNWEVKRECKAMLFRCPKSRANARGKMAEWSIAAVLKTVDLNGSGGSNPSLSALKK